MTVLSVTGVTHCLKEWEEGSPQALSRLIELAYDKLARQAHGLMRRERAGHTLQTRALVHETYIRLLEMRAISCKGKQHFYAMTASIMRRILVDHARNKSAQKRGGDAIQITMGDVACCSSDAVDVIALDSALARLALRDTVQVRIVELRCFAGLTIPETAETLSISAATVKRKWTLAKAFLYREIFDISDECTQ